MTVEDEPQGPVDRDYVDGTTDEYQYRLLCLKMAHMAEDSASYPNEAGQLVGSDMNLDRIMERAKQYWEFILGTDDVIARLKKVSFTPDFELKFDPED